MNEETGKRIRNCRRERKMRQVELAALIKTRQEHISEIENGKVDIRLSVLQSIAEALGVHPLALIGRGEE